MDTKLRYNGGYIGLLALLISLTIITFLIVNTWAKTMPDGKGGETTLYRKSIDDAEGARAILEQNSINTSKAGLDQAQNAKKLLEKGSK